MWIKRTSSGYALLALVWVLIAAWQLIEHKRFDGNARTAQLDRAREIARTMGVVIRSQGRFGVIRQTRLEAALEELAKSNELKAVMLLNAGARVVASAGHPVDLNLENLPKQGVHWGRDLLTMVDLVDLGSNAQNDAASTQTAIVLNESMMPKPPDGPPPGPPPGAPGGPPPDEHDSRFRPPMGPPWSGEGMTSTAISLFQMARSDPNSTAAHRMREEVRQRARRRDPSFMRPFWMSDEQYRELLAKQGLHGFVLQMSTAAYKADVSHDLWVRFTILMITLLAVGGMGLAWRNVLQMDRLQLRLLRASEMNAHLQELNVAAAGLAHETRNPLNIVRGLAQLIAQSPDMAGEIRRKATQITQEVDRVTGRLNEFINYSRSPEPRPAPTRLLDVLGDVERALESDLAEKNIHFEKQGPNLLVETDESLLRQVIFNLLLNATQAVGQEGHVEAIVQQRERGEASLEIRDNGPGVPPELRQEIFKPYFTTRAEGTGLGLAVVHQIVRAHRWEVEYVDGKNGGAGFRISGIKVV